MILGENYSFGFLDSEIRCLETLNPYVDLIDLTTIPTSN